MGISAAAAPGGPAGARRTALSAKVVRRIANARPVPGSGQKRNNAPARAGGADPASNPSLCAPSSGDALLYDEPMRMSPGGRRDARN
jgi:hypothetical protein